MPALGDLQSASILNRRETDLLLAFLLKKSRTFILSHPEKKLTAAQYRRFNDLVNARRSGMPLAYLTGEQSFYNLNLKVSSQVLIPRPETEIIVDLILEDLAQLPRPINIIDVGTGSGAIILSLAENIKKQQANIFLLSSFFGLDISASALCIARQNANKYGQKIHFFKRDLLNNIPEKIRQVLFDDDSNKPLELIITANLPYLTLAQIQASPSIQCEPNLALNGGRDGLKYYRALFRQINKYKTKLKKITIYCEIDPSQKKTILKLAAALIPQATYNIYRDLRKKNRFLKIVWTK
jgi:release factor glutamine methyltransferase